ncbi:MAG: hypothetical protein AB6733_18470 [Clostridiaceae bacterium]
MKFIKSIFNYLLSIICALGIFAFFSSLIINTSLLSPSYYYNNFQKNNYYQELTDDINSKLSYLFLTYNIPQELSQDIISKETIKSDVDNIIKVSINFFIKKQDKIDMDASLSEVEGKLDNTLNQYLYSNKIIVNSGLKKEIDAIKSNFISIIKNQIEIFDVDYVENSKSVDKVRNIVSIIYTKYYVFLLVSMLALLLNFVINKKDAIKLNLLIAGVLGLVVFMIAFSGYLSGFYNNIVISVDYIKVIVVTTIRDVFIRFSILGLVVSILTFALYKLVNLKRLEGNNLE